MIDIQKLMRLRKGLDIALRLLEANGMPPGAKLRSIDAADDGVMLNMEDGSKWKIGFTITKVFP